jgi:hypothetical protein
LTAGLDCIYSASVTEPPTPGPITPAASEITSTNDGADTEPLDDSGVRKCHYTHVIASHPSTLNLTHLELLHHFLTQTIHDFDNGGSHQDVAARDDTMRRALVHPYLMSEILAFAAHHLSKLRPHQQERYHTQATALQTEAINSFNIQLTVTGIEANEAITPHDERPHTRSSCCKIAAILFSSILGIHVLSETLSCTILRSNFNDYITRFVSYLRIHRGVHDLVKGSWQDLRASSLGLYIPQEHTATPLGNECKDLEALLESADLSPKSISVCQQELKALQQIFDTSRSLHTYQPKLDALTTFLILLSPDFLRLIELRKGEALAVLAHFAVLIHCKRDHWVFQDSGRYMIESIVEHLGTGWEEWLKLPKTVLESE